MHPDRTNRVLLALLGLVLFAGGAAAVLAGTDTVGDNLGHRRLLDNPIATFIGDNSVWFWPVTALAAAVLAMLALRWLLAVLPRPRAANIAIQGDPSAGRTPCAQAH